LGISPLIYAQLKKNPIEILNIYSSVQADKTKIIFQTSALLPLPTVYNSRENPQILIIEFDNVKIHTPKRNYNIQSPCVTEIRIQPTSLISGRAEIKMKTSVPYRVYTTSNSLVVEFKHKNSPVNINPVKPVKPIKQEKTDKKIAKTETLTKPVNPVKKKTRYLQDIKIEKSRKGLRTILILNDETSYDCFEVKNPERIVIDLFDVVNKLKPSYKIGERGIIGIRTAQYKSNPEKITRVVFDVTEKPEYKVKKVGKNIIVDFYSDGNGGEDSDTKKETTLPVRKEPIPKIKKESKVPEKVVKSKSSMEKQFQETQVQENKGKIPQEKEIFKPKTIAGEEPKYKGERVTLKFKDADLRDVVIFLANIAGLNVVFDPGVSGRVTCDFVEVPWDQALEIILKSNKLGMVLEGNVLRIATPETLAREEEQARRLREAKELAGPIKILTRTLSYARVADIKPILEKQLSPRGEIIIDERSNTLIISDIPNRVEIIEKLIETLDVPNPQVSIEARIVEATSNFARNLGIQWGFRAIADAYYGNQTSLQFPNSITVDGSKISGILAKGLEGPLGGYAINLPAPVFDSAMGISFGNVLDTFRLDMALSALETSGEGRIISAPKITTQNNMEAEIIQGRQIPVQTVANFTVTTRYVNAALELRVTPQITAEGTIIMKIEIRNNAADFANLVNGIPPIITQSASTTVMVKDGGTAVIGGIYRMEDTISRSRVPLLHKIPIIGNLFKSFSRSRQNRELLIFITPRIVRG
jgi:type IV pilus assembly protein PilQ